MSKPATSARSRYIMAFGGGALILTAILCVLFWSSFKPNIVVFSNDGPLGVANSESLSLPSSFSGFWMDLYWIGGNGAHAIGCLTSLIRWALGPVGYSKFYAPLAILLCGVCAWGFFRTLGLNAAMSTVGAIGAALNSNFFSNTCWGLGSRSITLACIFLALAALGARRVGNRWLNAIVAGMAVGMGVVEGADNGVIFSLFVAAYVLWQGWVGRGAEAPAGAGPGVNAGSQGGGRAGPRGLSGLWNGALRLALVGGFAMFMATQSLISLFDIASKGAVSATADPQTREQKWLFATQWSLPPKETIRVLIPGIYGYRMDTQDGGNYWGRVGETPGAPGSRFSGAGEYAGVLVVLLSIWSLAQSVRRNGSPFSVQERRMMRFWGVTLVVAAVLSWGKYTPFYGLTVYQLPYFSSIRNPMKFMHVAHLALMVLFAYGLLGMGRRYLEGVKAGAKAGGAAGAAGATGAAGAARGVKSAGAGGGSGAGGLKPSGFDQGWKYALIGFLVLSVIGLAAYASNKPDLVKHLQAAGFDDPRGPSPSAIASFSVGEVFKYVVFMALSVGALLLVMRGVFAGRRAVGAAVVLGLVLTIDLGRANTWWVVYWDYPYKYATNPILDILKEKPHEARVVSPPELFSREAAQAAGGTAYLFPQLYGIEWVQHHFQYYNIQSIDVAQDPRPPADKMAYMKAMRDFGRYWQLTNTRYVLGMSGFLGALNQQVDHGSNRFRIRASFNVAPKPGVTPTQLQDFTAVPAPDGPLALFEYAGALPRAKLYAKWQVATNDDEALRILTDPAFNPWSATILSDAIPASPGVSTNAANADGGTVEFASYAPQRIELKANATAASVLLLNDRYDKDWVVSVDAQPAKLLRANFIMRGVQVPPGQHSVVFEFKPPLKGLKISLAAIALSVVLCGLLFFVRQPDDTPRG